MPRWMTIAMIVLAGIMLTEDRVTAQSPLEIVSEPPPETSSSPSPGSSIVGEPPESLEFDSSALDRAKSAVLWNRNWFLASAGAQALGWIFLGAAFSQCDTINGVEVCPGAADRLGVAGAAIVVLSGVPLLVTGIIYGMRSRQKKALELQTLRRLTQDGRYPPPPSFDEYRLTDAQDRIRSTRNGLIASTAMFGVGWIFLGLAIPRCQTGVNDVDLITCTNPGYAHFVVGLTIAGSGSIGMVVSGILLGVRKRNKRVLERSVQRRGDKGFRWDPQSGSFVF